MFVLQTEEHAADAYRHAFGAEPELIGSAPGRVNLIGEHTDYNGGFVLPCAINFRVATAMGEGPGELYSVDFNESRPSGGCKEDSWADYPRGVAWSLADAGHIVGRFQAAFAGDVPLASGLSSSAAIECATAVALNDLFRFGLEYSELARLCQRAENRFVGVNSGIMDQYASLLCERDAALLIDCRSLEATQVPLHLDDAGLSLLVCDTNVDRALGNTGYNDRRAACERAARELGVDLLRDATQDDLERLSGVDLKRARHVVSENDRVLEAAAALQHGDYDVLGRLMYASHASLRDDYEVSTPELDAFVAVAAQCHALGARLTGAGFGGCAIALISQSRVEELEDAVVRRFAEEGFEAPAFYAVHPSEGAEVRR
jgi:galactokinase